MRRDIHVDHGCYVPDTEHRLRVTDLGSLLCICDFIPGVKTVLRVVFLKNKAALESAHSLKAETLTEGPTTSAVAEWTTPNTRLTYKDTSVPTEHLSNEIVGCILFLGIHRRRQTGVNRPKEMAFSRYLSCNLLHSLLDTWGNAILQRGMDSREVYRCEQVVPEKDFRVV